MTYLNDLTGRQFGKWQVLSFDQVVNRRARFIVRCQCGTVRSVMGKSLQNGDSTSCGCKQRKPRYTASCNGLRRVYRTGALKRGRSFDLTEEEFRALTSAACHYCGGEPASVFRASKGYNGTYVCNGIDRVDNAQGYSLGNCVTCCKACNRMKYQMSDADFIAHCLKVVQHSVRVD